MWWEQLTKTVLDSGFQADDSGFQALELLQVYNPGQKGWGDFSYPSPFCKKLESGREFTVVNTAMPRSPTLNKVKVHTYTLKYFQKFLACNTQHCSGVEGD